LRVFLWTARQYHSLCMLGLGFVASLAIIRVIHITMVNSKFPLPSLIENATEFSDKQPSALKDVWVRAGGCKQRYPKGQSRTCYQECGCHLILLRFIAPTSLVACFSYLISLQCIALVSLENKNTQERVEL